jgi:hypothetical protein
VPVSNKRVFAVPALWACLSAAGCGDNPAIARIPVRIEITRSTDTVYVGEIVMRLAARVFNALDEEIPDVVVSWSSSEPAVAEVDTTTGAVTGRLPGSTRISARAGSVSDTALVFVFDAVRLGLPYDTLLLAVGDTFTLPYELAVAPGRAPPVIRFTGGGGAGVATIDSITGFVTAVADGERPYVVTADSTAAGGLIVVETIVDTLSGAAHLKFTGALELSASWIARSFNHPTDFGTLFQLRALEPNVHEFDVLLIDSLVGPGTRTVQTVAPNGLGSDPVCQPPASFVYYRRTLLTTLTFLSQAGGTVSVTSDRSIPGGRAISGRLDVTLQQTDQSGPEGQARVRGTFVIALLSLTSCPGTAAQAEMMDPGSAANALPPLSRFTFPVFRSP